MVAVHDFTELGVYAIFAILVIREVLTLVFRYLVKRDNPDAKSTPAATQELVKERHDVLVRRLDELKNEMSGMKKAIYDLREEFMRWQQRK